MKIHIAKDVEKKVPEINQAILDFYKAEGNYGKDW